MDKTIYRLHLSSAFEGNKILISLLRAAPPVLFVSKQDTLSKCAPSSTSEFALPFVE